MRSYALSAGITMSMASAAGTITITTTITTTIMRTDTIIATTMTISMRSMTMDTANAADMTTGTDITTTMTTRGIIMHFSWGRETIHTYTKEQISDILRTLEEDHSYGNVLRAKGMVAGADGEWIYFDMVPGEHEVRAGAPEYTGRICVIGAELAEEKLAELFGLA